MFDLYNRSVLHTFGEVVDPYRIVPALPHADMDVRHDFSVANLRQTAWLHRRVDVDYNGWWMCLIPTKVIKEIGLSLPLFIKWDDAEYGLRAREAGFATVSLPGAAVWHVSWIDKDDLVGLAGVLPRAQPADHHADPQPLSERRARPARIGPVRRQAPGVDAVLHRTRPPSRRCGTS